jgi:hypothetical protein
MGASRNFILRLCKLDYYLKYLNHCLFAAKVYLYDPPPCWAAEFLQKYFVIFLLSTQDINTLGAYCFTISVVFTSCIYTVLKEFLAEKLTIFGLRCEMNPCLLGVCEAGSSVLTFRPT